MAILILLIAAVVLACSLGALAALGVLLKLFLELAAALLNGVPRGVWLFLRLATWAAAGLVRTGRYLHSRAKRVGLWAARRGHAALFVVSHVLHSWYVSSELRKRKAP